jgi:hypothetical protein
MLTSQKSIEAQKPSRLETFLKGIVEARAMAKSEKAAVEASIRKELVKRQAWLDYHVNNPFEILTELPENPIDICRLYGETMKKYLTQANPALKIFSIDWQGEDSGLLRVNLQQPIETDEKTEVESAGYELRSIVPQRNLIMQLLTPSRKILRVDYARKEDYIARREITLYLPKIESLVSAEVENLNKKTGLDFRVKN